MVIIGFFKQLPDIVGCLALLEKATEGIVSQLARNVFECSKVVSWSLPFFFSCWVTYVVV